MNNLKTDNSFFKEKVKLRIDNIPKKPLRVLDCFSGSGAIWNEIQKQSGLDIESLQVDQKDISNKTYIKANNLKVLKSLSLDCFDVIDLDA